MGVIGMSLGKQIGPEFQAFDFTRDGRTHEVFRGGSGPAVLVLHEMPGLHPGVIDFARAHLADLNHGCFDDPRLELVISDGKDKPGVLSASVSNTSGDAQRLAFALPQGQPVYAETKAYSEERLSDTSQVQLPSVPVNPGDVITLTVQSPAAPAAVVVVPVLPASGYYATLAPTAVPSTTAKP